MDSNNRNTTLANLLNGLVTTQFNVTEYCRVGYVSAFLRVIEENRSKICMSLASFEQNDVTILFYCYQLDDAIELENNLRLGTFGLIAQSGFRVIEADPCAVEFRVINGSSAFPFGTEFYDKLNYSFNPLR